jgi:tetratricopeptide (TPR) repeat protein
VKPYVERAGVIFPVAVDTADVFGQAFGLKAIPVSFLVDEVGIVRLQGGGPSPDLLRQVEGVLNEPLATVRGRAQPLPAARSKSELERRVATMPDDWQARLALAQHLDVEGRSADALAQCEAAAKTQPREAAVFFTWGLLLLNQNQKEAGLSKLKQARDLAPDNWRIRKQIWAIEHPGKFYTDRSPDFKWQKEELAREKAGNK